MAVFDAKSQAYSLIESFKPPLDADHSPPQCRLTIYDTAMVAMLSRPKKTGNRAVELVYPESFQCLLDHQQFNGGWEMRNFRLGTIMNTLAGLLAIAKRRRSLSEGSDNAATSLDLRATKATEFLRGQLANWDPKSDMHSGSIVLVQALLVMLRAENIHFQFRGSAQLERQIMETSCKAETSSPQSNGFSPMLYYLEAHVDALEPQNSGGMKSYHGISCSPSSTAAFLLGSKVWDEEYEAYLSAAIKATDICGGVPSLFPPSSTEAAYTMEVLVDSGLWVPTSAADSVHMIKIIDCDRPRTSPTHITECLDLSTQLLVYKLFIASNKIQLCDQLELKLLKGIKDCNPSFEEGCRILKTLLRIPRVDESKVHISSMFQAICALWWAGSEGTTLSRSPLYPIMLFAEIFAEIYEFSNSTPHALASAEDIENRAPIIIVQMLAKVLSSQNGDGSWGPKGCSETTAYAILALIAMAKLPHVRILKMEIVHSIESGRQILSMTRDSWAKSHSLWSGKTAYGSDRLSEAFSLAAMQKPFRLHGPNEQNTLPGDKQSQKVLALAKFFHGLENLAQEQLFKIKAGALESAFYVSMLKSVRNDIFPPTAATEKDKYLDYIPIMWTIHSIVRGTFAPPQFIWDIAVISMFIFLVDEYMESKVATFTSDEFSAFRKGVEEMFAIGYHLQPAEAPDRTFIINGQNSTIPDDVSTNKTHTAEPQQPPTATSAGWTKQSILYIHSTTEPSATVSDRVRIALFVFSTWARQHMAYTSVLSSSTLDLLDLRMETRNYLLCHIHQLEDSQRLAQQPHPTSSSSPAHLRFQTQRMGYAPWVHTIGGGHIGAPIGLVFFACVVGSRVRGSGKDCFSTVRQKLMAWNCNTHAAKQLRMYNDYGSMARDAAEDNLSSLNFLEFFGDGDEARSEPYSNDADNDNDNNSRTASQFHIQQTKQTLLQAAEYERRHTNAELAELYEELRGEGSDGAKIAEWLGLYYAGGDQFSDMYLVRDVTNGTKQPL